jgi:hypothetical protein
MDSFDTVFRSVDQWKAALITLPDTHFFDLMRSIFGNIQSPFNKQRLLDELEAFLLNHDIQNTIAAYIDEADHKIIAAIAALNGPRHQDLLEFFSGEYSHAALDSLVINLEERLIVYVVSDDGSKRLSLNPLLKTVLSPFTAGGGVLFPYVKDVKAGWRTEPVFDDLFLAVFLTFILPEKRILKGDGTVRKNLLQKINTIFEADGSEIFVKALYRAGLLPEGQSNRYGQRLLDFARLTEEERFAYCAAGVYMDISGEDTEILIPRKNFMRRTAAAAAALFDSLDQDKGYTFSTLKRIAEAGAAADGVNNPSESAVLVKALEKAGLLLKQNELYRKRIIAASGNDDSRRKNIPLIAFNSFFSFVLLPEITFSDVMEIAPFCEVVSVKASTHFKITRDSAVRGFNRGISGKTMFEILKKLSFERVDDGMEATLNDWEKRHSEIILMDGISIVLSEGRRYMTRTEALAPHIILNPMPGVYLLDFKESEEAAAALKEAGADMISRPCVETGEEESFSAKPTPFFISLTRQARAACFGGDAAERKTARLFIPEYTSPRPSAAEHKKRFYALLNELCLSRTEREELAARIERRLIVSPRQLKGAFIRYERREAKGLDYAGKLSLVKQALVSNETLEIIVQDSDGSEKYVTGIPSALEKSEGETILNIKPPYNGAPPDGAPSGGGLINDSGEVKISMGKIRVIRRIKRSIFSN